MKVPAIKDLKGLKTVKAVMAVRIQQAKELEAAKKPRLPKPRLNKSFLHWPLALSNLYLSSIALANAPACRE